MQDIIATIVAQEMATIIVAAVASIVGTACAWTLAQLGRFLDEKRMALLNEQLGGAIERVKADAEAKGLTGESAKAYIAGYLKQTMAGKLAKLKATDEGLSRRITAQMARDALAQAVRKAGAS